MDFIEIAKIHTDFPEKFGIPRQSGLIPGLRGTIVFSTSYRNPDALRGLEEYSHIWLIWGFSMIEQDGFHATVAPPRLGGRIRMGVFATRSPFRPNPIGLSCVRLEKIEYDTPRGPLLHVSGADMMDGTPIYDIKPYLPHIDAIPDALGGFSSTTKEEVLEVILPDRLAELLPNEDKETVIALLSQDPRPRYLSDEDRTWGISYKQYNIRFTVKKNLLTVNEITFL